MRAVGIMRIMGVDPGLNCTGYGLIDQLVNNQWRLVEGGVVRTTRDQPLEQRLAAIFQAMSEAMAEFAPDVAVVEKVYSKHQHPRTAIMMGHARGVIYLAAAQRAIPVHAYPASEVKKAVVGHGRAGKDQVAAMVCRMLGLSAPPAPSDIADALALALCHASPLRALAGPRKLHPAIEAALTRGERKR